MLFIDSIFPCLLKCVTRLYLFFIMVWLFSFMVSWLANLDHGAKEEGMKMFIGNGAKVRDAVCV